MTTEQTLQRDPVAIFGAGGVGLELGIELMACGDKVVFLDDSIFAKDKVYEIGSLLVGGKEKLLDPRFLRRHDLIVALGDNETRRELSELACSNGAKLATFIHPDATVGIKMQLNDGVLIMRGATVSNRVAIGKGVIINQGANVPHDCVIGNYVNICDGVTFGCGCQIGDMAFVGLNATIIPGIKIGRWAKVGAGAVVIKDVPDGATVVGNPARLVKRKEVHGQADPDSTTTLPQAGRGVVVPIGSGSQ